MKDLIKTTKHQDLIYDIGLHKGEDTEFYLRKGFRVIAFEALPELVHYCKNRLKLFIDQGQLIIIEGAIVDLEMINAGQEKVLFYKNDDSSVWGTVHKNWAERNERLGTTSSTLEVNAINIVEVIREHGVPHFMKIDIEGCDMVCIYALKKFQERPDYLSIESDKINLENIKLEIDLLDDLGYDCFQAIEQSEIPLYQSSPNPPREGKYVAHQFGRGSSGLFGAELGNEWKSKNEIIRRYRTIRYGYYLLGDDGVMNQWKFRGSTRLRNIVRRFLRLFTRAAVPGWYDTHARHSCVTASKN